MTEIEREVTLPAGADVVWDLLTCDEELAGWLGDEVDLDAVPGGSGRVVEHDGTAREVRVDEVVEGRRLVWRWWPEGGDGGVSQVQVTLSPVDGGTRLTVVERPLPVAQAATALARASTGWSHRLLHLELLVLLAAARV